MLLPSRPEENLEHYVSVEVDTAAVGYQAELVSAAEGGGKIDSCQAGRHVDGIDDVFIHVEFMSTIQRV